VVYPNPTSGSVEITTNHFSSVDICDVFGKFIFSSTENIVDLSNQPTGVYFLNIKTSNGLQTMKRIVRK
jgi:hypothetical protein